jgi:hypothetical protein
MTALLLLLAACGSTPLPDGGPYLGVLAALDDDHDGVVTRAEYEAAAPNVAAPFAEVDVSSDGALSAGEIAALVHRTDPTTFDPGLLPTAADGARPTGAGGPPPKGRKRPREGERGVGPDPTPTAPPPGGGGYDGSGPALTGGPGRGEPPAPPAPTRKRPPGRPPNTLGDRDDAVADALRFEVEEVRARDPAADLPSPAELRLLLAGDPDRAEVRAMTARVHRAATAAGLDWPAGLPE